MSKAERHAPVILWHIVESIDEVQRYIDGLTLSEFRRDSLTQDAVILRVAVIGEGVKRLPLSLRKHAPSIPWKKIAGMRDILIHDYLSWDLALIWRVARHELPKLRRVVKKLLDEQDH